jgi:hypothetical protein
MLPPTTKLIGDTICRWAHHNAQKIFAISQQGSWEGWTQAELALELQNAMSAAADHDHPDTLTTVQREQQLWIETDQHQERQRADLLVGLDPHNGPLSPYSAIELKCWHWQNDYLEVFYRDRVPADVKKLTTCHMKKQWYQGRGCHVWAVAIAVMRPSAAVPLPPGFHHWVIPVPNQGHQITIAYWRKTVDDTGKLRDFDDHYVSPRNVNRH